MWPSFCQCLAEPGTSGEVLGWWRCEGEHCCTRRWLTPLEELASAYPCGEADNRACQRNVESIGREEYVAACSHVPARCNPVTVPREKLVLYQLSWEVLRTSLCSVLGLEEPHGRGRFLVGTLVPRPAIRIPVYCVYGRDCWELLPFLSDLVDENILLVVPTEQAGAQIRQREDLKVFSLEYLLDMTGTGELRFSRWGRELWNAWVREVAPPQKHGTYRFRTPADAKWSHIRLSLGRDHQTLAILCRTPGFDDVTDAVHCMALGMAHKKHGTPNKQWNNLSRIMERGCYDCQTASQQKRMEMPMSRLRTRLKEIFSIAEDPLPFRDNAYRPEFLVG